MKTEQIVLAQRPQGMPDDQTFRFEEVEIQKPQEGEVKLKALYISVDPYMRGRMSDSDSYVQPFELNEPIHGHVVAQVTDSHSQQLSKGDIVVGILPWRKEMIASADEVRQVPKLDVPDYLNLSVLGMPGQTAYHGLLKIGQPQQGETVVVSAASGAVGSVVGQIAKLKGSRVVGIAGGTKKTHFLTEELGFDAAVDYKADDFADQLEAAVPQGIDVYYENVGGTVADEVFKHLNTFARIPVCGSISNYNDTEIDYGPRIQPILIKNQALMKGFVVHNYQDDFANAAQDLAKWVKNGDIQVRTSVEEGFDKVPAAFKNLFTGDNFGKQVVKVAERD
ncbi:NADP-dependent oxidoreductase [Staphylococcus pettenkoferi]|uniref:NADP-dependent oxidoreductase n=1 Tax=Staphylococcus pettenkoferi TaxID=170573 RepID=A0A9Q4H5J8_9STAP|nr:NADP-dependent oxidoreductase [Staphylococcus pettenkoferi]MCY1569788.1 NADP-dependent oxidoreductase [Staphylococcus pettenkoferi]MCY1575275.1 NADP-dependent oxidoreductase [Staphylococcus pettenkoferi]MCY1595826.1 NADP-dependent oxidoreductase [Staphylococcus pettenkoferi]MCY1618791.1 NADP-dependent oxidoreductase [Staphylococcus pettenkoferi]